MSRSGTDALGAASDHVAAARAGCPAAMNDLLAALRPGLVSFCRSRLASYAGGREAAEDVAQDVCVAVYRVLPRYQDRGSSFGAWVYAIAAHKIADAQRRFGRAGEALAQSLDDVPETPSGAPTPEDAAMARAGCEILAELMQALPQRTREVMLLRAAGISVRVVAERIGISPEAVRVTQHRGLRKLRRLLGETEARPMVARLRHPVEPAA